MYVYMVVVAIVGLLAGILLAACSKKAEGLEYGKLDKAGRVTNIVLIPVYIFVSVFCMAMGIFAYPGHKDGFLRVLGLIVAGFIPSASLFCGVGLGLSVRWRKKGMSKKSFWIQFLGLAAAALGLGMFFVFYGNLLGSIN